MILKKMKAKKLIKNLENVLDLNIEQSYYKEKLPFAINSVLLGCAVVLSEKNAAIVLSASLLLVAYLSIKKVEKNKFNIVDTYARQEIVTKGKMNRMQADDVEYLAKINEKLSENNLQFADVRMFYNRVKVNNMKYLKKEISKSEYTLANKQAEQVLLDKIMLK